MGKIYLGVLFSRALRTGTDKSCWPYVQSLSSRHIRLTNSCGIYAVLILRSLIEG